VRINLRILFWLLRRSLFAAFDDGCFAISKGAAYSALLAFFPVITSATAILIQTRAEFVSQTVETYLREVVPPGTEDLVMQQFSVKGTRPVFVLIVAGIVSLWAASGVIKSLIDGFESAYRVPRGRGFVRQSAVAMALVLLSAVPLVGASLLVLFGGFVEGTVLHWAKIDPILHPLTGATEVVSRLARYLLASGTTVAVTTTLYYFGPNRRQRWRYCWPGAVLASLLWLASTSGFAWYVRHVGRYNPMYGSVGVGIVLLVWMYLIAAISLIGCEFNAETERLAASLAAHPLQSH
jgi:membrane protein